MIEFLLQFVSLLQVIICHAYVKTNIININCVTLFSTRLLVFWWLWHWTDVGSTEKWVVTSIKECTAF